MRCTFGESSLMTRKTEYVNQVVHRRQGCSQAEAANTGGDDDLMIDVPSTKAAESEHMASSRSPRSGVLHLLTLSLEGGNKRLCVFAAMSLGLAVAGGISVPALLGRLLDDDGHLGQSLALLALAVLGHGVGFVLNRGSFCLLGQRVMCQLRIKLFAHLIELDTSFHDEHSSGSLASRLSTDVASVAEALDFQLPALIEATVIVAFGFGTC